MYSFDSRVRFSELGEDGKMTLCAMINYLQDRSTFQSEAIGKGIRYLKEQGSAWILNSWQIEVDRYPEINENITISTWSYGYKSMYGYRNFSITDAAGNDVLRANSVWVLYDLNKKRPRKVVEEDLRGYEAGERLDMGYSDRKLRMPESREKHAAFPVRRYQIDTNGHMNNGQYVRVAQECIPEDFEVLRLSVEYRKSAVYGDVLYPETARTEQGYAVSLNDKEGKVFAIVMFSGNSGQEEVPEL